MAGLLPSDAVAAINLIFADLDQHPEQAPGSGLSPQLQVVLDIVDRVPAEHLNCSTQHQVNLIAASAIVRKFMELWQAGKGNGMYCHYNRQHPVLAIREALAACSDQAKPLEHAALPFIADAALRSSIQQDITGAHQALANGEWKAACILAGAAIEALLHWRLEREDPRERAASTPDVRAEFARWGLHELINAAEKLVPLTPDVAQKARAAKDYRNLIHPGKAERTGLRPTRSSAYVSVGGMEAIVEAMAQLPVGVK